MKKTNFKSLLGLSKSKFKFKFKSMSIVAAGSLVLLASLAGTVTSEAAAPLVVQKAKAGETVTITITVPSKKDGGTTVKYDHNGTTYSIKPGQSLVLPDGVTNIRLTPKAIVSVLVTKRNDRVGKTRNYEVNQAVTLADFTSASVQPNTAAFTPLAGGGGRDGDISPPSAAIQGLLNALNSASSNSNVANVVGNGNSDGT